MGRIGVVFESVANDISDKWQELNVDNVLALARPSVISLSSPSLSHMLIF